MKPIPELSDLTREMFDSFDSGALRGGIKHEIKTDLGLETHECYQFKTVDDLTTTARAFQRIEGMKRIRIMTHGDGYRKMRTLWEWVA